MSESQDDGELAELLGSDLLALVRARAVPLTKLTAITALPSPVRARGAFFLEFADGTRMKGRRLRTAQRADAVVRLRRAVGGGFARIVARRGDAMLLEWVEGASLASLDPIPSDVLRRCGRMLGAIHRRHAGHRLDGPGPSPSDLFDKLERNTQLLLGAQRLDAELARRALAAADANHPEEVTSGIIHKDFCAENLVLGRRDALVCIDDASLSVGPHDLDLARTWYRWPMDARGLAHFESGYEEHRSVAAFHRHLPFWATCVLVASAATRLRSRAAGVLEPIDRLRRLHARGSGR
jgi:Ser/Thr protein kinase RdoA (MazF antagonist)